MLVPTLYHRLRKKRDGEVRPKSRTIGVGKLSKKGKHIHLRAKKTVFAETLYCLALNEKRTDTRPRETPAEVKQQRTSKSKTIPNHAQPRNNSI